VNDALTVLALVVLVALVALTLYWMDSTRR
jgi:hypothetical protein